MHKRLLAAFFVSLHFSAIAAVTGEPPLPLPRELEAMLDTTQALQRERNLARADGNEKMAADATQRLASAMAAQQSRLGAIIAAEGWPRLSVVGARAATSAMTVVLEADLAFMRRHVVVIRAAAQAGEADKSLLAQLEDRILVEEGKPQRYGTQVMTVGGKARLFPVADAVGLDQRRKEVGLLPICTYLALVARRTGPVEYAPCVPSDPQGETDKRK